MKKITFALAILALAFSAHATKPGNNGGGNGGCGVGQTTNGCGGSTPNQATSNSTSSANAAAVAGAAAISGSASHADGGKAVVTNDVKNSNSVAAISGGNKIEGNKTSVTIEGDKAPTVPVATAYAAPLAASNGTCMGSTSVGGQGVTIGLSMGTTWTDAECNRRYNSIRMQELGQTKAAVALMCQDSDVRAAMEAAGTPCPEKPAAKTTAAPKGFEHANMADPFIARRAASL